MDGNFFDLIDVANVSLGSAFGGPDDKVVNNSNRKQRYKVSAKHLSSGVKLKAFSRVFRLSRGEPKRIRVFLWVKNRRVPFPEEGSLAYGGLLKVKSKHDVINIPWSFSRAAEVELNFDEAFQVFTIFNKKYIRGHWGTSSFESIGEAIHIKLN